MPLDRSGSDLMRDGLSSIKRLIEAVAMTRKDDDAYQLAAGYVVMFLREELRGLDDPDHAKKVDAVVAEMDAIVSAEVSGGTPSPTP